MNQLTLNLEELIIKKTKKVPEAEEILMDFFDVKKFNTHNLLS